MKTFITVISIMFCLSLAHIDANTENKPNIIFILADDLGYADLGCYGHPYAKTSALDQLAKEGTRFTQYYVAGITCSPSRTAFMTGIHSARYQKYPGFFGFGKKKTITELLKNNGYTTGHFGKWHIGPENDGVYGIDEYDSGGGNKAHPNGRDAGLFDKAIEFIKKNKDKPFYMNVWGHISHYPVNPHKDLTIPFKDLEVNKKDFSETMQKKFRECKSLGGDIDKSMQNYLADVSSLDACVKKLLDTLDELNLTKNTIVVFSSDHGPAPVKLGKKNKDKEYSANMLGYADAFKGGKHSQYEGGVRVPFIVRWPEKIKANYKDETSVLSALDWLPTLCSITGIKELPADLDGENSSSAWFGNPYKRQGILFWKTSSRASKPSMRMGPWKYHIHKGEKPELFNLDNDPYETKNVIKKYPEVVVQLDKELKKILKSLPDDYKKLDKKKFKEEKRAKKKEGRGKKKSA